MSPSRRAALLLALAFSSFYAATTRGVLVFGDDLLLFQVTEAILDRGEVSVPSPADRGDVARSIPGRDGRRYSKYGLGLSLAAIPFDLAGRAAERAGVDLPETRDAEGNLRTGTRVFAAGLVNAAAGGLAVAALFWLALEAGFPLRVATALAGLLGAATFFAHYAATLLSEPLAAAALTGAVAAALRWKRLSVEGQEGGSLGAIAVSGLLAGVAVLTKTAHLIAAAPIGLWIAWSSARIRSSAKPGRFRSPLLWTLLFLPGLGATLAYNFARFGSVLATGYGEEATRFTTPLPAGLAGLLVSPGKGLLWYAPPVLLALFGTRAFWRRRPDAAALLVAAAVGPLLLSSSYYQWHGGGSWGPRLLAPILPLALLPAGELLSRAAAGSRAAGSATAAAAAAGVLVTSLALFVPFDLYNRRIWPTPREPRPELLERAVWSVPGSPLVVHAAGLPRAISTTAKLLLGLEPMPGPDEKERPGLPDLAFARYGSHALLQWTRAGLLAAALAGLALLASLRGRRSVGAD